MTKKFRAALRRRIRDAITQALEDTLEGRPNRLTDVVRLVLSRLVKEGLERRADEIHKNPIGAILSGTDKPGKELRELIEAAEVAGAVSPACAPLFEVQPAPEKPLPPKPSGLLDTDHKLPEGRKL